MFHFPMQINRNSSNAKTPHLMNWEILHHLMSLDKDWTHFINKAQNVRPLGWKIRNAGEVCGLCVAKGKMK